VEASEGTGLGLHMSTAASIDIHRGVRRKGPGGTKQPTWLWILLHVVLCICVCALLNLLYTESRMARKPIPDAAVTTVSFRHGAGSNRFITEVDESRVTLEEPREAQGRLAATFKVIREVPNALFATPPEEDQLRVLESCSRPGQFLVAYWDATAGSYVLRMQIHPGYSIKQRSKRARFRFSERGQTELLWTSGQRGLVELSACHQGGEQIVLLSREDTEHFRAESAWTAEVGLSPCTAEAHALANEGNQSLGQV